MSNEINTSRLELTNAVEETEDDSREVAVKVDHVSMVFNIANEQLNSLKEYAIALMRRELMFKEFRALDDVSFEVKKGDVFGILGTNGSGKSTMLKIIAGVLEPTKGSCEVNGRIAPLIELGAGFDMELTARENIYLNGALLGYSRPFIEQHFDEIVEFAEIEKFLDMPMKNYSSGMVARIAFAIATVIVPEILICDEVLSVGDFMFQQKCERRIMSLIKEHNVTVLIVSHNNEQIARLCNKAIWIEKGHTRMMGKATDVCNTYRLLGGHTGSAESEQTVFKLLNSDVNVPEKTFDSIVSESRYGSAAKLCERSEFEQGGTVIIGPGEQNAIAMITAGLSGLLEAPALLSRPDDLPDATAQELAQLKPSHIIVLGNEGAVGPDPVNEIQEICPDATIKRIDGFNAHAVSVATYHYGHELNIDWGRTAVLTYNDCIGDLISLSPFSYQRKAPTFFVYDWGEVGSKIKEVITKENFDKVLVLAGFAQVPDEDLKAWEEQGVSCVRILGHNPYHANELINNRMSTGLDDNDSISIERLIVSSVWNPFDSFTAAAYAGKSHSAFLLEDPRDLDSVAHAIDFINEKGGEIKHLTFLGDNMRYGKLDKEILAKAVIQARTRAQAQ